MLLGYLEETSRALSANLNAQQSEARPERLATQTQRHDPDSVTPGGSRGGGGGLGAGQAVPAMRNLMAHANPMIVPGHLRGSPRISSSACTLGSAVET